MDKTEKIRIYCKNNKHLNQWTGRDTKNHLTTFPDNKFNEIRQ